MVGGASVLGEPSRAGDVALTPDTEDARHARSAEPGRYARFLDWQEHAVAKGLSVAEQDAGLLRIMRGERV